MFGNVYLVGEFQMWMNGCWSSTFSTRLLPPMQSHGHSLIASCLLSIISLGWKGCIRFSAAEVPTIVERLIPSNSQLLMTMIEPEVGMFVCFWPCHNTKDASCCIWESCSHRVHMSFYAVKCWIKFHAWKKPLHGHASATYLREIMWIRENILD